MFYDDQETYFMKVPSSRPKGVLYQKYHNTITKLRRHELWSPKKLVVNKFEDTSNKPLDTESKFNYYLSFIVCF